MNKHLLGLLVAALLLSACEQTSTTPTPAPTATNVPPTATPVPEASPTPGELPVEVIKDVPYVAAGEPLHKLDIYRPQGLAGPFPTLFAIHGGGSNKSEMAQIGYHFAKRGYAVVSINHRQTPQYAYPVPVQDTFCALAWVHAHAAEYGLDPARLVALGHSAGGTLAAMLGTVDDPDLFTANCPESLPAADRVRGVVAFTGIFDYPACAAAATTSPALREYMVTYLGGEPDQVPDIWKQASPITWVDAQDPPVLLIHGLKDLSIDPEQSKRFASTLERAGVDVELLLVPEASHNQITRSEQSLQAVEIFCARLWGQH